ncbi:hypothetical protein [Nocardia macrotermitis]|uniref:Uncharacterized protein n=1 Tax=Nocardia macrotermitis TaxID=2585198 RepID=A0A7K0CYR7_9NOCA|nr:hypothetical protein [Nocardia macrotermitis]MQY18092.1 hypothetical protein [Nocardia macrotermitis]
MSLWINRLTLREVLLSRLEITGLWITRLSRCLPHLDRRVEPGLPDMNRRVSLLWISALICLLWITRLSPAWLTRNLRGRVGLGITRLPRNRLTRLWITRLSGLWISVLPLRISGL